jgi:type I restriction enzyme R subunit
MMEKTILLFMILSKPTSISMILNGTENPKNERVLAHKSLIFSRYIGKQQEFLDFVLDQYIKDGVEELDRAKLPQLLELKYHTVRDAVTQLGSVANISEVFIEFQQYLYSQNKAA